MNEELDPEIAAYLASRIDERSDKPGLEGSCMDGWRIGAKIGTGGTSDVYRAVRESDGLAASVKVLREPTDPARKRFEFERRLLASALSKSLPRLFGSGEYAGSPYVVIELLEPVELPETEKGVAEYMLSVSRCVDALHAAGIIHRDIKPQNVMRRQNGEIVLIDFGLAKDVAASRFARDGLSIVDGAAVAMGTPGYAAPEQFTGGAVTVQTDIHGLGMLIYKCFAENRLLRRSGDDPIPRVWREIVRRATCTVPEERYASVAEFVAAIRRRGRYRGKILAAVGVVGLVIAGWIAMTTDWVSFHERRQWGSLCSTTVTNLVTQELVSEQIRTQSINGVTCFMPLRIFRSITNSVEGVKIDLAGKDRAFASPIRLRRGERYFVSGPGKLDAVFEVRPSRSVSESSSFAELHLSNCSVVNRSPTPVRDSGITYHLDGGAILDFPFQPDYHPDDRCRIAPFDGQRNRVHFPVDSQDTPFLISRPENR